MTNFDDKICLEGARLIPSIKCFDALNFFRDDSPTQPLYGCEKLQRLISVIPKGYIKNDCDRDLYLPINRGPLSVEEIFTSIDEKVIDLQSLDGLGEAGKRIAILAYGLSKQPHGEISGIKLNPNGSEIRLGNFKFSGGEIICFAFSFDTRKNAWCFKTFDGSQENIGSGYWFAFSPKLKGKVNRKMIII